MAIIGRYILIPDIFDILRETKQDKVIAYKFKGTLFDCGSVQVLVGVTNYFYKQNKK